MKKLVSSLILMLAFSLVAMAGVPITKVDKVAPTDEIFMDMATTAAFSAKNKKGLPCGAVVILNNAWRATGTATDKVSAEQDAMSKARLQSLENATIFTVNEPTTEAYNDICRMGADAVVFVNPRADVIAAGIYPASAWDDAKIDTTVEAVPMKQIDYSDAKALLK